MVNVYCEFCSYQVMVVIATTVNFNCKFIFIKKKKDFLMFYQIFLLPQVKSCAIITYKHGMYELPNELPSDLRLKKYQESV